MTAKILFFAVIFDLVIGDPGGKFHPVVLIGKLITLTEKHLYKKQSTHQKMIFLGALTTFIVLFITWGITYATTLLLKFPLSEYLLALLLSFTISIRSLTDRGTEIYKTLSKGNLAEARVKLSYIVSRDTKKLDEGEVIRGTLETMSENFIDGFIAPLFWYLIFGLPGAYVYRASNTLDAMVGYRNERYEYFGKIAAKTDDLLNYLPARIGGIVLIIAGFILGFDAKRAILTWSRDAKFHPSPNAGIPESVIAGLLGVRLGGNNYYGEKVHFRAYLGEAVNEFKKQHIMDVRTILFFSTLIFTITITMFSNKIKYL